MESRLSIVPGVENSPPDFLLTLPDETTSLPLCKIAAAQFGRLSGIKPSVYREFARDERLTAQMVHHSLQHPDRGGDVIVCVTSKQIVNIFLAGKPYMGLVNSLEHCLQSQHVEWIDFQQLGDGSVEAVLIGGKQPDPTKPGIYMLHAGRPLVAPCVALHDWSLLIGKPRGPKKKKSGYDAGMSESLMNNGNVALGESQTLVRLVTEQIPQPTTFLSRMSLMFGFSGQASQVMLAGAAQALPPGSNYYEVVRYVASLAMADRSTPDRRYQFFAHYVFAEPQSGSICLACGLPK